MNGDRTVAAVIARDLAGYGARRCFGLLGTANFKISHALVEAGVELVSARHECNAASMADAYAKSTQELALVSVHSGPGLTNALTGIAEAAKSRTPLLVLAGDVPAGAVKSNFHFDQAEMVRSVGAIAERIHTPATAREDALRAVTRAVRDRQTVVLSLPIDVQDAKPRHGRSHAPAVRCSLNPAEAHKLEHNLVDQPRRKVRFTGDVGRRSGRLAQGPQDQSIDGIPMNAHVDNHAKPRLEDRNCNAPDHRRPPKPAAGIMLTAGTPLGSRCDCNLSRFSSKRGMQPASRAVSSPLPYRRA